MPEPKPTTDPHFSHGGTTPPFVYSADKEAIFAESITPLEKLYACAFKDATAAGERTRGAHYRALQAVHRNGRNLGIGERLTLRQRAGLFLQQLGAALERR